MSVISMIPFLFTSRDLQAVSDKIDETLTSMGISKFDIQYIDVAEQTETGKKKEVQQRSIGIQAVKQLRTNIYLSQIHGPKKAIVIKKAHLLTTEAQNALLKILEEPPDHVVFLLGAKGANDLLPTIISRCNVIPLTETDNTTSISEDTKTQDLYNNLQNMTVAKALMTAESLTKDKENLLPSLEKVILYTRIELHKNLDDEHALSQHALLLRKLQEAYRLLKDTNANPRLALENCFLSLV